MCGGVTSPTHYNKKVFKKMDKKMYFEPEMEVIDLKLQGMLCTSDGSVDEDGGTTQDETPGEDGDF